MTHDDFLDKQFHLSVTAGMNQRYHQIRASYWTFWNRGVQISVAILAVAGAILAWVAAFVDSKPVDQWSVAIASLAAVLAVVLNVVPLGDFVQAHLDWFRRWSDYREDIDGLLFELKSEPSDELIERLKELDAKMHRICGSEPAYKEKLLNKCFEAEKRSRQPAEATPCGSQAAATACSAAG